MAHEVDRDVQAEGLRGPLLWRVGVMAGIEVRRAVGVEPCTVSSTEDVFGAVGCVREGNEGWVMGEVVGVGPGRRFRDGQGTG
jgi:hypothetical protein